MAGASSKQPRPRSIEALLLKCIREQLPPGWTAEKLTERQAQRSMEKVRDNHQAQPGRRERP